jgi:hypothetical protein
LCRHCLLASALSALPALSATGLERRAANAAGNFRYFRYFRQSISMRMNGGTGCDPLAGQEDMGGTK